MWLNEGSWVTYTFAVPSVLASVAVTGGMVVWSVMAEPSFDDALGRVVQRRRAAGVGDLRERPGLASSRDPRPPARVDLGQRQVERTGPSARSSGRAASVGTSA